jgi:hypothetical protein
MKKAKFIIFLILMLYATISEAQTKVGFSYDVISNRVKREIIRKSSVANKFSNSISASSIKPVSERIDGMEITIYPNPTLGQLSVEITCMPQNTSGEITIYNMEGKLMQHQKKLETLNQLDLSTCLAGIYILRIKIEKKVSEWKIVKK